VAIKTGYQSPRRGGVQKTFTRAGLPVSRESGSEDQWVLILRLV